MVAAVSRARAVVGAARRGSSNSRTSSRSPKAARLPLTTSACDAPPIITMRRSSSFQRRSRRTAEVRAEFERKHRPTANCMRFRFEHRFVAGTSPGGEMPDSTTVSRMRFRFEHGFVAMCCRGNRHHLPPIHAECAVARADCSQPNEEAGAGARRAPPGRAVIAHLDQRLGRMKMRAKMPQDVKALGRVWGGRRRMDQRQSL